MNTSTNAQQRLIPNKGFRGFRALSPASTLVPLDKACPRNPLLGIAAGVMGKFKKRHSGQTREPPTIQFDNSCHLRLTKNRKMETRNHFKNGAVPKSLMSRKTNSIYYEKDFY